MWKFLCVPLMLTLVACSNETIKVEQCSKNLIPMDGNRHLPLAVPEMAYDSIPVSVTFVSMDERVTVSVEQPNGRSQIYGKLEICRVLAFKSQVINNFMTNYWEQEGPYYLKGPLVFSPVNINYDPIIIQDWLPYPKEVALPVVEQGK